MAKRSPKNVPLVTTPPVKAELSRADRAEVEEFVALLLDGRRSTAAATAESLALEARIQQRAAEYKRRLMQENPQLVSDLLGMPKLTRNEVLHGSPPVDSSRLDAYVRQLAAQHEGLTGV